MLDNQATSKALPTPFITHKHTIWNLDRKGGRAAISLGLPIRADSTLQGSAANERSSAYVCGVRLITCIGVCCRCAAFPAIIHGHSQLCLANHLENSTASAAHGTSIYSQLPRMQLMSSILAPGCVCEQSRCVPATLCSNLIKAHLNQTQ